MKKVYLFTILIQHNINGFLSKLVCLVDGNVYPSHSNVIRIINFVLWNGWWGGGLFAIHTISKISKNGLFILGSCMGTDNLIMVFIKAWYVKLW